MGCLIAVVVLIVGVPAVVALVGGLAWTSMVPTATATPAPTLGSTPPAVTPPGPTPDAPTPPAPTPDRSPPAATPTPAIPGPGPDTVPDATFPPLPPPHSGDPAWVTVQQAPIYAAAFPDLSGCPAPALLSTMADLEPYASAELGCIQDAWRPVLAGLGLPATEVPHFFFSGSSVTSPCGTATAPAYYCSANGGSIHIGEDLVLDTSWDPIWAKDIIGHEYGHHLQGVSGFFDAIYELPAGNETVRRNEIQATCFSMGMLRHDDSVTLDRVFYDSLEPHLRSFIDDDIHGSPDSLAHWGMRGFHGARAGECNTWVVGPELVE